MVYLETDNKKDKQSFGGRGGGGGNAKSKI